MGGLERCSPASRSCRRLEVHVEIIFFSMPTPAATRALDLERHRRRVLQRDPGRVEDRHLVVRLASLELAADHLADLAGDVGLGDQPLA